MEMASQGDLFGNLNVFGSWYQFDDGKEEKSREEKLKEEMTNSSGRILNSDSSDSTKAGSKSLCRTDSVYDS